jgi:2-dehydropantoate 2-reductase
VPGGETLEGGRVRIAVMGAGAIGGYIGGRLAARGAPVTFIARGAHLAALRASGLAIVSPLGDLHVDAASATDDPASVGEVDLVLLATKLYDVEAAARAIAPLLGRDTAVICLQNGVEAPDVVARLYGAARVVGGVVIINGEVIAPGVVRHNALNHLTVGELDGRATPRLERFVALATAAGIETVLSRDVRLEIWRKFLVLAPMAALSAMTRLPLGRIREQDSTWRLAELGMREVVAVARARGVGLTDADVEQALAFVQGMPATWKASLAVDLEHRRRLEIDWLSGAVARLGRAAGVPTPFHDVALGVLKPHAAGAG